MPTHVIAVNGDAADTNTGDVQIPIFKSKVILTDSQIKGLTTSDGHVILVPAPGAGKSVHIYKAILVTKFTAGVYVAAEIAAGPFLGMQTAPASVVKLTKDADCTWLFENAVEDGLAELVTNDLLSDNKSSFENRPVVVYIQPAGGVDELSGGNAANTLEVTVFYSIVDL
jgi:hypothetical protein